MRELRTADYKRDGRCACFRALWAPPQVYGHLRHDLDAENKIRGQTDYGTIDLKQGPIPLVGGAAAQISQPTLAKNVRGSCPPRWHARLFVQGTAVSVAASLMTRPRVRHALWPGGFNENDAKMTPFAVIITVPRPAAAQDDDLARPRPTTSCQSASSRRGARELTVACLTPQAATEDAVRTARGWKKARGGRPRGRPRPRGQLCGGAVRRDLQRRRPAQRGLDTARAGPPLG